MKSLTESLNAIYDPQECFCNLYQRLLSTIVSYRHRKGGTSLSKGFGLIERFSEDLDLKIEPGSALPQVSDWTRESRQAIEQRRTFFETLSGILRVPGAEVHLSIPDNERRWRGANLEVRYRGRHLDALGVLKPFVLLEVGSARVTPSLERDCTSFVHDYLDEIGELAGC